MPAARNEDAFHIACLGGAVVDRKYRALAPIRPGTSNPVVPGRSWGGVARNVCEALARLGARASLVSVVGDDEAGRALVAELRALGVETQGVRVRKGAATAEYVAVLEPDGTLQVGLAAMGLLDALDEGFLDEAWPVLAGSDRVFVDANASPGLLVRLVTRCREEGVLLALDGVSVPKVVRLPEDLRGVDVLFVNLDEARALVGEADAEGAARALRRRGAARVVVTDGARGAVWAEATRVGACPAVASVPVDVTGAGDALIAATLWGLAGGMGLDAAVGLGCLAAARTIERGETVHPELGRVVQEVADG